MNIRCLTLLFCVISTCFPMIVHAADGPHWTYEGEHGPEFWGELSPDYIQCKVGLNQSPINITHAIEAKLPPLVLDYNSNSIDLVNNGHTVQVNVEPGNYLRVEDEEFELVQFHVHAPSEHRVEGKEFLLEVHYVHQNAKGEIAVIGVLYEEGEDHPELTHYFSGAPTMVGKPVKFRVPLIDLPIVEGDTAYFRYNGSLTTPPCSEGVRWYVLKEVRTVSQRRRDVFSQLIGDDARGPQPINARPVLR